MTYLFDEFQLDPDRRELRRGSEEIPVEPQVFDILALLTANAERMLTKEELLDTVWGDRFVSESALSSRIKAARQALGDNGRDQRIIQTVHGHGFKMVAAVTHQISEPTMAPDSAVRDIAFLFSDIEGSTQKWSRHGDAMRDALAAHDAILRQRVDSNRGMVFKHTGDGMAAAFDTADDAIAAAVEIQQAIQAEHWETIGGLAVRMSIHFGEAVPSGPDFLGHTVSVAGKLLAIANGGQILTSDAAAQQVTTSHTRAALTPAGAYQVGELGDHVLLHLVEDAAFTADQRPLRALIGDRTNLPRRRTRLVGRSDEIERISDAADRADIVSIVGPGGAGKTSLGLEVGHRLLGTHPGGVWFCELAPVSEGQVASTILGALDNSAGSGQVDADAIVLRLGEEPVALVFDNCEHVIDEAAKLAEALVDRAPNLTILATSREALDVRGEQVVRVDGLPFGGEHSPAVSLFLQRTREVTDLIADQPTLTAIADIVDALEGLPLAIELAAPRLVSMTPEELRAAMGDQLSLLGSRRRHDERQSAMDRAIGWSFDLLTAEEQSTLKLLSVFAGAFTSDAATAITDNPVTPFLLHRLVEQSMLTRVPSDRAMRFRLLEPIRQYVARHLDSTESEQADERHARHFAARAADLAKTLRTPDEAAAADELTADWADLSRAISWGLARSDASVAVAPLASVGFHLYWQQRVEAFAWIEAIASDPAFDLTGYEHEITVLRALGAWRAGDVDTSKAILASIAPEDECVKSALVACYIQMIRNDFDELATSGATLWRKANEGTDSSWLAPAAAFRLITRAISDPSHVDVSPFLVEVDEQMATTNWATARCWGLLSKLTVAVVTDDNEAIEPLRQELDRVAAATRVLWFTQIQGALSNAAATEEPISRLSSAVVSARGVVATDEVTHQPLTFQTVATALADCGQWTAAAQIIGFVSALPEISAVQNVLAQAYDGAVAATQQALGGDEHQRLLGIGMRFDPLRALDVCEVALEVAETTLQTPA